VRRPSDPGHVRAAAVAVLVAAAWIVAAGRLSVWFDLHALDFGGGGFVAPTGASGTVLDVVCVATAVLAVGTAARPGRRPEVVLAIAALALSVVGLVEWWSEAAVDADLPAGALRATPVEVLVSPTTAGWLVLASLVTLQGAAAALLPRHRAILAAIAALVVATAAVGLLAPDRLSPPDDQVIR
jgi:hypothetical protein